MFSMFNGLVIDQTIKNNHLIVRVILIVDNYELQMRLKFDGLVNWTRQFRINKISTAW